jgi:hypothetical protein
MRKGVYSSISSVPLMVESPFVNLKKVGVYYKGGSVVSTNHQIVNSDTGETSEVITRSAGSFDVSDSLEYVKVYKDLVVVLKLLSMSGVWCLYYVLEYLPKYVDYISIDVEALRLYCGYKHKKNVSVGLLELVNNGVLSKKGKDVYWVNPNYLFRGSRKVLLEAENRQHIHSSLVMAISEANQNNKKQKENGKLRKQGGAEN